MKVLMKFSFLILLMFLVMSCSKNQSSGGGKFLTGKAALGVYFPDGSPVELRGAAVAQADGTLQPSTVSTSTVVGSSGDYTVDVSSLTAPYLIRVEDKSTGNWYYSYTDGTQLVANANPYTDMLVRSWYKNASEVGGNPANVDIDAVFSTGVYPPGTANIVSLNPPTSSGTLPDSTPISLPNPTTMARAGQVLSATVSRAYSMDLENVLTADWVPGVGFDSLLDNVGVANLKPVIDSSLTASYFAPSYVESALLYLEVVMTQSGTNPGSKTVRLTADIYSAASTLEVKDARSGYGQTIPFSTDTSGTYTRFYGSMTLSGLPALYYQLTVDGNSYSTVSMYANYYGTMTFNSDGSVASFTAGSGAVVNSATSSGVQYSISDLAPIDAKITAHGSQTVLFEKTYTRESTWSGSDVLSYDTGGQAFDLYLVGSNGGRTRVEYSP